MLFGKLSVIPAMVIAILWASALDTIWIEHELAKIAYQGCVAFLMVFWYVVAVLFVEKLFERVSGNGHI